MMAKNLVELDRKHYVHPVAPLRVHERRGATIISAAEGCFITDSEGHELLDGFAGLWCVNAGYGQRQIIDAVTRQLERLPYATGYFHFASEPAIELAGRLSELAPGDLNRVFFTLGGSDAIDTIIRLVHYYHAAIGENDRKHVIGLERGYHGSSSTGAGLTGLSVFHRNFGLPLSWQYHIPSPYPYRHNSGPDGDAVINASVEALLQKVDELGRNTVAAFICEPVQGGGGVIVPPAGFLKAMEGACRDLGILFIVDEVVTGFGRTGRMFACEHEGVIPDFMSLAKGLTSGYCPMGAVMMSEPIYQAIADAVPDGVPLGHGFTYSGHPASAAAGLTSLKLYLEGGLVENAAEIAPYFATGLDRFRDHPLIGNVRHFGLLGALELVADKETKTRFNPEVNIAERLSTAGYENGLIFRAFSDGTVGFAPPLCITETEVDLIMDRLAQTLLAVQHQVG